MIFKYITEMGVPFDGRAVYDENAARVVTVGGEQFPNGALFKIVQPIVGLSLLFRISDGAMVGLECDLSNMNLLKQVPLKLPAAIDGTVKAKTEIAHVLPDVNYLDFNCGQPVISFDKKIIFFGEYDDSAVVFRPLQNILVCIGQNDKLQGVFVYF